jgi:hypothetical protein
VLTAPALTVVDVDGKPMPVARMVRSVKGNGHGCQFGVFIVELATGRMWSFDVTDADRTGENSYHTSLIRRALLRAVPRNRIIALRESNDFQAFASWYLTQVRKFVPAEGPTRTAPAPDLGPLRLAACASVD